ncbi:hypothetical protein [Methylobacterium isbiliense]|jgi:hypothetical protein|uniref:Uncharacterized protein n=1 Tax=Methylobacterium isbiliense TaxID=315478 RepID=A0ABQ4SBD0_9HYPH|nr:hypothetical protein [Methylobacterium isbiliense]MDN3623576.1 hypothetical protein [Methylobacterium isbiliense]GJD99760.1 hypothetical protein GMJLKIPL_1678 [Methylobacterium isbiliense]
MRITIDMSEAESRSATIHPAPAGSAGVEEPAANGGAAPVSLLMALGASGPEGAADPMPTSREGLDGGGAPDWLIGVIEGGR